MNPPPESENSENSWVETKGLKGKHKLCKEAKQNKGLIHNFIQAGRCSAIPRKHSSITCGVEYPLGRWGSAVASMSPQVCCVPDSSLVEWAERQKGPWLCARIAQQ